MTGPRPFSTHGVTFEDGIAVKRLPSHAGAARWLYGDEPRREWRALELREPSWTASTSSPASASR